MPRICIKASRCTALAEASTMQLVSRNTSVPVPKVHCACRHNGTTYIAMERITGTKANVG